MVDNDKAIIMMGTGRNTDWPEKVPSYKHPVIVRLVNETNVVFEPIVVLQIEHGVTGYERFELRPKFLKEIANTDKFYANSGGMGYPSLALDSKKLLKAIHDLQDPNQKNNWTAHARIVENLEPKLVVLSLEDNGKMNKDQALDYFDDKVYVFDNKPQGIPKNISEIKPEPHIYEVLKAPVQYNTENWKELVEDGNKSRENSEGC